jgi:hypothetical protein
MKRKIISTIEIRIVKRTKIMETTFEHNLRTRRIKFPGNQQQYYNELNGDKLSDSDKEEDIPKEPTQVKEQQSQIVKTQEDKISIIAKGLAQLEAKDKGEAMEFEIKKQFEKLGITTTLTKASGYNPYTGKFEILGDNGTDGLAQIKINNEIIKLMIQAKNWKNEINSSQIVQSMQGALANQYPDRIGLLIINDGGISTRLRNLINNTKHNTILIYNFKDLGNIRRDLTQLHSEGKLQYYQPMIEEFEDINMTENVGKISRNITAKKYRRIFTQY